MLSGRHFILLGLIACAGLLSVHAGQKQIDLCYKLAAIEKELRDARADIELARVQHQALQSPGAVMLHAAELKLPLRPISLAVANVAPAPQPATPPAMHSLGSPQGVHRNQPASAPVRQSRESRGQ